MAAFLVQITAYSDDVFCNTNTLARDVKVSKKTATRALDQMFAHGLHRIDIGNWENGFISKFNIAALLEKIRKEFADVVKSLNGYQKGKIDGQ